MWDTLSPWGEDHKFGLKTIYKKVHGSESKLHNTARPQPK